LKAVATPALGLCPSLRLQFTIWGASARKTGRQSYLFNVAVCAAAVYCAVMRIDEGPIARRAKSTRENEMADESVW